jgi:hypothetical protein
VRFFPIERFGYCFDQCDAHSHESFSVLESIGIGFYQSLNNHVTRNASNRSCDREKRRVCIELARQRQVPTDCQCLYTAAIYPDKISTYEAKGELGEEKRLS